MSVQTFGFVCNYGYGVGGKVLRFELLYCCFAGLLTGLIIMNFEQNLIGNFTFPSHFYYFISNKLRDRGIRDQAFTLNLAVG